MMAAYCPFVCLCNDHDDCDLEIVKYTPNEYVTLLNENEEN